MNLLMEPLIVLMLFVSSFAFLWAGYSQWSYRIGLVLLAGWFFFQSGGLSLILLKGISLGLCWYLCCRLANQILKDHESGINSLHHQIEQKDHTLKSLHMTDAVILEESAILARSLAQKEALYESLKELNKTLEFSKTIDVSSELISRLTSFEKGWLLVRSASENHTAMLCYEFFRDEKPILRKGEPQDHLNDSEKQLFSLCANSDSLLFIEYPDQDPRLNISEKESQMPSMTAIGLYHEEDFLGAFILEGCKRPEMESLEILAIQLSMEIKETLLYEKVRNLSFIDGLTQVYLRRHLLLLLEDELKRLHEQKKPCSILMIDIDHFKNFNDRFGHLVGDILLRQLSSILQENLRPTDLVGRFGGEEFLIALPETIIEEALEIAQRIRRDVETREYWIHEKCLKATLSIGIANDPRDAQDLSLIIQMADTALYQAKNGGRNQVRIYGDKL